MELNLVEQVIIEFTQDIGTCKKKIHIFMPPPVYSSHKTKMGMMKDCLNIGLDILQ